MTFLCFSFNVSRYNISSKNGKSDYFTAAIYKLFLKMTA